MELLPYTLKWFEVLLRWSHVLFAILWVGNSFLFNYLDNKIEKIQKVRKLMLKESYNIVVGFIV